MRTKLFPVVALCLMCLFSTRAQTVFEKESVIILNEKDAKVSLAIENPNDEFSDRIELKILDENSNIRAEYFQNLKIETGKKIYQFNVPVGDLAQKNIENFAWFRLQYRVGETSGIVSLSEILQDVFELRVIAADQIFSGMNCQIRVRAVNPYNEKSVRNVSVSGALNLELKNGNTQKINANGETNAEGFAVLNFQIPVELQIEDSEIKVTGKKNGYLREASDEPMTNGEDFQILMLTDKPIYQPEQSLNVRGILMKGYEAKTVVGDVALEFRIKDEDGTILYREKLKTSSFGIAAITWKIPENAKLGNYGIEVRNADDDQIGYQQIKISRYDLPNFAVNAKALKPFYLPNEKRAEIEVSADYLFGKPVTKGKIRVVRENNREWNWKEQKYDVDEGEAHEGTTDNDGKFSAEFDLREDHENLKDSDSRKFRDLRFTAYFTDLTTNKTEQKRFDVRVTKEPIHVYFIGKNENLNTEFPVNLYVSTFYADGSPAVCDVELKGREDDGDNKKFRTILRTKTNSFGAGKLNFMPPKFEDADDDLEIKIIAKDGKGNRGTFGGEDDDYYDEIDFDGDEILQIETEKTIFKPGESVTVKINSTKQDGIVFVDVVKGWSVVDSHFVNLKNGKAELKIPFQKDFQGELKITAATEETDGDDLITTARGIIFPAQTNLKLAAEFDKQTYKPGEDAKINFSVADAIGNAVESALGIVIFDKAVEERARTENDFNGMFANFGGWLGYGDSFAGVNVKDLNDLDLSKPISDELQLVAEIMLHDQYYSANIFHSRDYAKDAKSVYADYFKKQFAEIEKTLNNHYGYKNYEHPTDDESLRKILRDGGISFEDLRDPWLQNYRAVFSTNKAQNVLQFESAGADKTFGTKDDLTVSSLSFTYFTPMGRAVDKAINDYHTRTGAFVRDEKTLFRELGISELKDRFGRKYFITFEIAGEYFLTRIRSLGANGKYEPNYWDTDDFEVWTNKIDYFAETELKILAALKTAKKIPTNEDELRNLLKQKGIDSDEIRDAFGEKTYLVKREFSRYANVVREEIVSEYGKEESTKRTVTIPVTQGVVSFSIRSKGADKKENTPDDFTLAEFLQIVWEQSKDDKQPVYKNISFADGTGTISGTVTDANGAIVANAPVTATHEVSNQSRSAKTDDKGKYFIANLSAGNYSVKAEFAGFKNTVRAGVPVKTNTNTKVDLILEPGSVNAIVEISSEGVNIETSNSSISNVIDNKQITSLPINERAATGFALILSKGTIGDETSQKSTPKLREYFPETLVWSPELITDANGKAVLNFKTADNITTWKLCTIASTKNGKIGVTEKEFQAFQPFFVDLEPPKFLTDGDEIFLPVQIRNYTPTKQKVDVTMAKSDWFNFLSPDRQNIEVNKNSADNAVFGFKAVAPVKDGKQRVSAIAEKDSDAIEKPVTVKPNGQEIVETESKFFGGTASFDVNFPENALPKTPRAELKIYPNMLSHVAESVEGILQRPYGCGEQTISSTYPNLMILKFVKTENSLTRKAKKYLRKGLERLSGYQSADGGFSYWGGKSESDIALTAYALRFLTDAKPFVEVDEKMLQNAQKFLAAQQRADGSFAKKYYGETTENRNRTRMLTTYIARSLAMSKGDKFVLNKALAYLKTHNAEIDEPYSLALYALANFDAENSDEAEKIVERLQSSAKDESGLVYWNLETNTPFYGWGTTGRIETTALVLQTLLKSKNQSPKTKDLISKATMFLLKNKDRFGVWYSTQTTVNVLDAFLASLTATKNQTVRVLLNGEKIKEFSISEDQIEPLTLTLNEKISFVNRLEIETSDNSAIMAQVVKTHYVDWKNYEVSNRNVSDSRAIRLDYKCDKQTAKIMETINCTVEAERVGFQGYGMLLAEIGIPPGADVSRESLENAFSNDWSLCRYEILPDRIVVYLWAKAGGSKFNFSFKPRYGINAQTPASFVYDYYNEEAKATIAPLTFGIK